MASKEKYVLSPKQQDLFDAIVASWQRARKPECATVTEDEVMDFILQAELEFYDLKY
jgi:hypothetical protein